MTAPISRRSVRAVGVAALFSVCASTAFGAAADWSKVDAALGLKGSMQPGDVYKYSLPRTDLDVTLDGVRILPGFALGSWLAFEQTGDGALVMGDLVLLENEIAPVMQRLLEGGVNVSAVHNHLVRARPFPMYMHVEGHGDAVKLATTLRSALEASKTPLQPAQGGGAARPQGPLDGQALDRILGRKGSDKGGVYQFGIARAEPIKMHDAPVPPSMGTAIGINFEPAGDGKAATTGDFVLRAEEVDPVMRALVQNGIEVTALHSHMVGEEPRLYFMHFWGHDDAEKLAQGLKAALDHVALAKQ
ncbi:MAG TPA: DUF1259 domain-containing protein [Gammaproteobacteria bacterium]|nr:DUF1259 domain-containing protein [Gammaproteobacteria bacterium]